MPSEIQAVEKGTPAEKAGLQAGDRLLKINGREIHDVLDYKFYAYDSKLTLELEDHAGRPKKVKIKKREGEDLGLEFETYLMDKARACSNRCIFCFVDQLPSGMRKTLYFKDDDARLSFLMGNYITLTNLSEREVQRIIDLRISPINVSVHTTNPPLRSFMLGNPNGGAGIDVMRRFASAGIVMNCQIVCCPGINDGEELARSMRDLAAMYPGVNSVSVVPVGLTKHRDKLHALRPFTREEAQKTLDQVEAFSEKCLKEYGTRIFFCADELYLKAGREIPNDEFYEEYTQLENGVGMLRLLTVEFEAALELAEPASPEPFSIITGAAAAPFMEKLLYTAKQKCDKINGKVYAVENEFFGKTIDVAGLVTGGDIIKQLKGEKLGARIFIPQTMLRHGEGVFLDDITVEELSRELGAEVIPVEQDGFKLAEAIFGVVL